MPGRYTLDYKINNALINQYFRQICKQSQLYPKAIRKGATIKGTLEGFLCDPASGIRNLEAAHTKSQSYIRQDL